MTDLDRIRPERVVEHASKYIIGQEAFLWALARAIYHNLRRKTLEDAGYDLRLFPPKMNVLAAGPTGAGKTRTMQVIADYVGIPFFFGLRRKS